jgi:hypothetical protein
MRETTVKTELRAPILSMNAENVPDSASRADGLVQQLECAQ